MTFAHSTRNPSLAGPEPSAVQRAKVNGVVPGHVNGVAPPGAQRWPAAWPEAAAGRRRPTDGAHQRYLVAKRAIDVTAAAVLLVLLAPLLLLVALLVKLDSPGPVLFRQSRTGQHGRPFEMLKFRTMLPDRRRQPGLPPPGVAERRRVHKSPCDPRVTRVGRFLRRSALDELPQLWNVLVGEMSLVGPRPELPEIVTGYQPWQHARHWVVPGITGWWQVNRDDGRLMHEATELDLYYVEHQSLTLDLVILLRTFGAVARGPGAF